jgi:CRISPR-associated endonuclease/helicase Cas3
MLFSALVDADYLDTELHFDPQRSSLRTGALPLETLWARFQADQARISGRSDDVLSRARHEIYEGCLAAADHAPGFFRLTVPTGGGKTRAVMGFGLRHALRHGLRRVVVAVPFISITEQTADVYRGIFGGDSVLEHHSAVGAARGDAEDFSERAVWSRLAAENWDAPIVVTTAVQLFESLFANSTHQARKLHRLARSVIVLDEAQALPLRLLTPILDVLRQLCRHYGTTVVISTATQPAFETIAEFAHLGAREMLPDHARFFRLLNRVAYEWRKEPVDWVECAQILASSAQSLTVVNTKAAALALLDALGDQDAFHLSTLLCGAHRSAVIQAVRRRLASGQPCRLISTQIVEAGVDLDFPLVIRAMGPLDAIIQAAGRCNREGKLPEKGRLVVIRPKDGRLPRGFYRTATDVSEALLGSAANPDPNDPSLARAYFRRLLMTLPVDREKIQEYRRRLDYPKVAALFRMIDDHTEAVVVPYGSPEEQRRTRNVLERLRRGTPGGRGLTRLLQPYLVPVRTHAANNYRSKGLIKEVAPGIGEWLGEYDRVRGLVADDPALTDLIV